MEKRKNTLVNSECIPEGKSRVKSINIQVSSQAPTMTSLLSWLSRKKKSERSIVNKGFAHHTGFEVSQCLFCSTKLCQYKCHLKWQAFFTITHLWDMETPSVLTVIRTSAVIFLGTQIFFFLGPIFHIKHNVQILLKTPSLFPVA